jgi:flagellar biosynthetic protein FliR
MSIDIATPALVGFLLAMVRAAAWVVVAPPFSTRLVPAPAKVAVAAGLALAVAPRMTASLPGPGVAEIVSSAALQAAVGAGLGFLTLLVFAAVQAAGDLIDVVGGFSLGYAFDPLSQVSSGVFGRFYQLLATVLLFALNGHLMIIRGFMTSYDTVPLDEGLPASRLLTLVLHDLGLFSVAAVQIAAPLLGVLFLADAGLALLTRIAPALNAFSMSFPIKIGLTLSLVGLTFPLLPGEVKGLLDTIVQNLLAAGRG